MKKCCRCGEFKDESGFNKSKNRKDGLNPVCKTCCKAWRDANKEILLAKKKEYYEANRHLMPERQRISYEKHKEKQAKRTVSYYSNPENWIKRMLGKSKERARSCGLDFDIDVCDIEIPDTCPYLKIPLTFDLGSGHKLSNASLDRIDSQKGYIKGNVQVISRKANTMKNNASKEELIIFAKSILNL